MGIAHPLKPAYNGFIPPRNPLGSGAAFPLTAYQFRARIPVGYSAAVSLQIRACCRYPLGTYRYAEQRETRFFLLFDPAVGTRWVPIARPNREKPRSHPRSSLLRYPLGTFARRYGGGLRNPGSYRFAIGSIEAPPSP